MGEEMFDVVAVRIGFPSQRRIVAGKMTRERAVATLKRGVRLHPLDSEYYNIVPHACTESKG